MRLPNDLAAQFRGALTARVRALEQLVPRTFSIGTGSAPSILIARTFSILGGFVPEWVAMLAMVEDFVATWDDPRGTPKREADEIYIRDGWRCAASGCTSRQNLEEHHIFYKSRGGTDEASNRITLCTTSRASTESC